MGNQTLSKTVLYMSRLNADRKEDAMEEVAHSLTRKEKQKIECFVKIVNEYKTAMFRLAFSIVLNKEDAEDVVSEAVLKAYSHLKNLRHTKKMKAWIFQIIVNESKNCLKKRNQMQFYEEMDYGSQQDEETSDLFEFVCQLEERFREVVILYYFEEFKVKEIASILGITEGTVKSRLSRARLKLKRYLELEK